MAAPAAAAGSAPGLCPGYAVICSFLERYGVLLDLPEFTFPQLERYLSDTSSVPKLLVDLHIKLLRKIGKSVSADRWEKHLVKVCQDFNTTWAWELDKKGYKDMTVECKTGILKYLCECQFDDNVKFKTAINEEDPDKMRLQPIGRDKDGQMYWFQLDQDHNVRVYLEEQDDLDGSSWKCLVRDRNELAEILASLKTHIDPELLKKEQEEAASLKPEADGNKKTDDEDNKKTDDTTEDEEDKASKDFVSPVVSKEEDNKKLKHESEVDVSEAKSLLNDIQHSKTVSEPNTLSDKPCVDVHAKPIKEEPMEVSETTASKATSAKESLSECASRHTEPEDVRKKTTEDLQKAMKNDHQAKIPLKKREMKLSEDFDKSSGSIIVRNPSISQVKEPLIVEKINEENDKSARVKDLSSDNVNVESLHTTDNVKSHNNGLGKACKESDKRNVCFDSNEKQTNSLSGGECDPKEKRTKASTDKMDSMVDMDEMVARNTEEPIEVAMSTQEEKAKAVAQETIVEVVQEVAPFSSSLAAKPSPSSIDPIKPFVKSSDNKDEKNNESNEMCVISHAKGNSFISKETTKALTPEKRNEFDPSEKKVALKGKDLSELSEIEKSDVTKTISEPKPTETIITTETGKPEHVTYKPDSTTQHKEMPGVIHKIETTLSSETAEKLHGSKDSEPASVIKKTEVLKQSKGPESKDPGSLVSSKETNKSSVIKQADKTSSSKETERLDSSNDKTKLLVINQVNEQELSEHSKKVNSPKDTQTSCITGKNSVISGAEVITETPCNTGKNSEISEAEVITEKEDRVVFKVNSGNSARCQHKEKISNERSGKDSSKPDSKAVDVMAIKDNKTQLEDHISIKELPTSKTTEKVEEEKNKSLNPVEKDEPSNKVGQLVDTKSEAENKKKKIFDAPKEETLMPLVESSKSEERKMDTTLNAETVTGENKEPTISNDTMNSESKTIKDHSTAICDITSAKQPAKIEKEALTPVIDDKSEKDSCCNIEIKSVSLVEKSVKADDLNEDNDKTSTEDKLEGSKASEELEEQAKEHNFVNKEKKVEKCDSTEVQEKGIRLKIQVPTRRRKSEVQTEERTGDSDSETGGGRSLRRSPRISRPTAKVVEIQDRRLEKLQATASVEKEEEEEEEEEEQDEKAVQKKPREKKIDQEGQLKKGKKRRRTRWSSTRTRCNKKGSGDDDDDEDESSEQEDSEDEDDSDEDYKVERGRKRRRNRNRERHSSDSSTSSDDDLPPNDDPCKQCGLPNQPELILLCDSCDNGYHTACLRPPLMIIPDGEWFCPPCQHKQLCDKLEEQLQNIDAALKKRDRAERRKERLVYVGISVENIIAPSIGVEEEKEEVVVKEKKEVKKNKSKSKSWGRRSTRTKKSISYRFDEFDEAIEEAIEEDVKEAEGGGAGRGKDMANITGHRGKDMSTILHGDDGKENGCPPRPSMGQRRKKRRRLNDLDSDSTVDEEESEDEFRLSDSTEEEEFVASENAESEAEVDFNDSDFGSTGSGPRHTARSKRPNKRRKSGRQPRKRRNRGYSDDEEEETDEEDEEEEMVTEGSSEFSDSDLDVSRRRSRRSLKKQVNYCETSESEGSKAGTNRDKMKPRRRLSSSDSEASHSRGSEEEGKETRVKRRTVSPSESRKRRRLFSLKRRRASEDDDDDDDDDSDDSEEEDRPVRKRVNRIDSDDSDEEEDDKTSKAEKKDEEGILGKGPNPLEYNLVELPPTNGQNSMKGLEGFINRPEPGAAIGPPGLMGPKNICVTPVGAIAPNGMATQEMVPQDDDEDDLLGVTDLVDYVCNSEQL